MSKDAYYFSHDSNAQDDPKCMLLIDQLGMEGYGIFWALIERLRNEKTYSLPVSLINALAKRWYTSKEKVESVVKNYGLFSVDERGFFYSERLKNSMLLKTEKARESANYRWSNATALPSNSDRNASGMRKDAIKEKESKKRKEKERKVNKGKFPFSDDLKELPEIKVGSAIELIRLTRSTIVSEDQVKGLWEVFKVQNLTGKKFYEDNESVYGHFMNWAKGQPFEISKPNGNAYEEERQRKLREFKPIIE